MTIVFDSDKAAKKALKKARNQAWYQKNKERVAALARARYVANRDEMREQQRAYAAANPEKVRAKNKAWYQKNKEHVAELARERYEANREAVLAQQSAYYEANAEELRAKARAAYAANPEKKLARQKERYAKDPEGKRASVRAASSKKRQAWTQEERDLYNANQRARRKSTPVEKLRAITRKNSLRTLYGLTIAEWDAMALAQGGLCAICDMPPCARGFFVDHDHLTGKVRQLLCAGCNFRVGHIEHALNELVRAYVQRHDGDTTSPLFRSRGTKAVREYVACMREAQGGVCAICACPPGGLKRPVLHTDHNHATGRIRQLLCAGCNFRVAAREHVLAEKMDAYLRKHRV